MDRLDWSFFQVYQFQLQLHILLRFVIQQSLQRFNVILVVPVQRLQLLTGPLQLPSQFLHLTLPPFQRPPQLNFFLQPLTLILTLPLLCLQLNLLL